MTNFAGVTTKSRIYMEQNITLEAIQKRLDLIEEKQTFIVKLLTKKEREEQKQQEEKDNLSAIPPIPNAKAAQLLKICTRQLQRKRRDWKLVWEERGREVYYHVAPLIKAIKKNHLRWSEEMLEQIIKSNKRLPDLR